MAGYLIKSRKTYIARKSRCIVLWGFKMKPTPIDRFGISTETLEKLSKIWNTQS